MKRLNLLFCLAAVGTLWGCVQRPDADLRAEIPATGDTAGQAWHFTLDTLYIPVQLDTALTSMNGSWFTHQGRLCFGDRTVALIHAYNTDGHFLETVVECGDGRDELRSLYAAWTDETSAVVTLGTSWDFTVFNPEWHKTDSISFRFDLSDRSLFSMFLRPDPERYDSYELAYSNQGLYLHDGRHVVFGVTSEHPFFNGYQGWNVKQFFRYAHTLGILDMRTGKLLLVGHYPTMYQKSRLSNFMGMSFDGMDGTLYISFMADSLIYKMDMKSLRTTGAFGRGVRGLKQDYPVHRTFQAAEKAARLDRKQYGWYGCICCIPEKELIFRTCHLGGTHTGEALQVYRRDTLIGTFAVPPHFRMFGQIDGTLFAAGLPDLEKERFVLYKCKLFE